MNRKQFLKTCGLGCLAGITGVTLLQGCSSTQGINGEIKDSDLIVDLKDFEIRKDNGVEYRKYIIVHHDILKAPICVYRFDAQNYSALFMLCTHQGAELQVFGDKLQCAAHGSEFSNKGMVESGPAEKELRKFPVTIDNNSLKISLK
ncbi:Rieske (2Fe-2S) protein [Flavobacterium amniphilum]|uniref:QcrA and Rieske domain-containing protein n=1 Tax=Flavobacterium amniphilum TaxID=1834035 RepID=UPI002029CF5D|nr:Rieske (2Fe-2S) protein [Flavobacterium amniphilum]MCL9803962.1 Rieske (2Fe-2S) protein [Flavobacterium amniphilum]